MRSVILGFIVILIGCSAPVKQVFDKAVIERPLQEDGKLVFENGKAKRDVRTITDHAEVEKLASFFPGMGQGKESSIAGAWKAGYTIRFEQENARPVAIRTNDDCTLWSEGKGDWKPEAGLKTFMDDLFKKAEASQAEDTQAKPIRGTIREVGAADENAKKKGILGTVEVGSGERTEYAFTITDQTKIEKQDGKEVKRVQFDELKKGLKVDVICNRVTQSFPMQGTAEGIRIVEGVEK